MNIEFEQNAFIPSFLYGKFAEVKKECRKVGTKLKRGMQFSEIISNSYSFLEISKLEGKCILHGPSPLTGGVSNINLFALPRILFDFIYENKISRKQVFDSLVGTFWGHFCLSCGQEVYSYYKNEKDRIKYLRSLFEYFSIYTEISKYVVDYPFQISRMGLDEKNKETKPLIFNYVNFIGLYVVLNLDAIKKQRNENLSEDTRKLTFVQFCRKYKIDRVIDMHLDFDELEGYYY